MFVIFLKKFVLEKEPFLANFRRSQNNEIMFASAHLIRCNEHGKTTKSTLLTGTVKSTTGDVAKTLRENLRRDSTCDANQNRLSSITTVIRGYKHIDPNSRHFSCLPLIVFKLLLRR